MSCWRLREAQTDGDSDPLPPDPTTCQRYLACQPPFQLNAIVSSFLLARYGRVSDPRSPAPLRSETHHVIAKSCCETSKLAVALAAAAERQARGQEGGSDWISQH
eukprot:2775455-Rhodomonas_salina.1